MFAKWKRHLVQEVLVPVVARLFAVRRRALGPSLGVVKVAGRLADSCRGGRLAPRRAVHLQPRKRGYAGGASPDTRWTQRLASPCAGLTNGYPTVKPVHWRAPRAVVAAVVAVIVVAAGATACGGSANSEPTPVSSPPPATQETPPAAGGNAVATHSPAEPTRPPSTPDAVPDDVPRSAAVPASDAASSQDSSPRGGRFADAYTGPSAPAQGPSVAASAQGAEYTWQDGPATRRMLLQLDLVAQPTSENRDDDVVAVDQGELSIVRKQERHERGAGDPVFRTESGHLVTFPGGVLIMLDGEWDAAQVQSFFAGQGIDMSRVEAQTFGPNAFLVSTESGLAAVELANDLAAEEGVVYAVPDRLLGAELE